ncbi:hypothetical protein [Methylobacterium sp. J-068]|uniref:hypothetical protein n=1 Tax=Methylobacterium sp. J-068 TaxID=2836649 RepID=UPI001FBB39D3|nr:hypothetical protein [Methylobacterium sp. J-068]MCJ2034253.1 hypothetical protein [Methylobacterium sp. J-068]
MATLGKGPAALQRARREGAAHIRLGVSGHGRSIERNQDPALSFEFPAEPAGDKGKIFRFTIEIFIV